MNTQTQHTGQPDVIVVGGGIGGLSAAYALARKGLNVRVLERAKEFGEVGAGMQIAPNCTRILHEYGLLDEAKQLGVLPESIVMKDAVDSSELTRLDLKDLEQKYGFPLHGHPPQRPARHLPARLPPGRRRAAHRPGSRRLPEQ